MRLICVLLTVFVLGVTPAYADDDVQREVELVTDCEMIPHKGEDFCGLTLEEWKRVLKTNATYTSKARLLHYEQLRTSSLENQKSALQISLEALADSQGVLTERVDKLTVELIATDKKYQQERVKPRLGDPLAWTVAAAAVSVLVGFVAYKALD